MREANYRVMMVVVVAEFDDCKERAAKRAGRTGRAVPDGFMRFIFKSLQTTAPIYLKQHAHICEVLRVYTNKDSQKPELKYELTERSAAEHPEHLHEALALVERSLVLPPETPPLTTTEDSGCT